MKRFAIVAAVVLVLIGIFLVPLRIRTVHAINKIRTLEGQTGEFHSLVNPISAKYSTIEDSTQIENVRVKLGLTDLAGMRLIRFNGEGLPYFFGYAVYDTNRQTFVRVVVNELW
jgi:hypothetical protein